MDITSLNSDGAGESLSSCMIPPPLTAATSMGDHRPMSVDGVDSNTASKTFPSKMVVAKDSESNPNFYTYSDPSVLTEKELKVLENSVKHHGEMNCVSNMESNSEDEVDQLSEKDEEDPVQCGDCDKEFPTLELFMDHPCAQYNSKDPGFADNESELSDGESFNGKIVYNPDGSAYIIEGSDSDLSDLDIDVPAQDGAIVDKKGVTLSVPSFPQIANAFFVPRNPASLLNTFCHKSPTSQQLNHELPIMHSYRVYDVRSAKNANNSEESSDSMRNENHMPSSTSCSAALTVPTKPILMCFICKLSFGYAKSFTVHATTEHAMTLNQEERTIMSRRNASAIIQGVGKEKEPLMSFLEPIPPPSSVSNFNISPQSLPCFCANAVNTNNRKQESTTVSYVYTKPKISLPSTLESSDQSSNDVVSESMNAWGSNPTDLPSEVNAEEGEDDKPDNEDEDGSASENESNCSNSSQNTTPSNSFPSLLSVSASEVTNHANSPEAEFLNEMTATTSAALLACSTASPTLSQNPIFTGFLGICDEHPQGRAQGVECPKCDMVLSSSQSLGGHMTMMHSRNSCKTLKCPKCNWHYKYQETLEIHMKEKHPENDTQCIYCITNQAHPRLARGETYSCGYKPYRCDVCNYSTTTKGNLSIHMQSDKHINNMQELANGGTEIKLPPQTFNNDETQYKKNKPKQTWRCDVCNYETTVARNLRIHMTSEKHTHNMMVLQQNMKHMQRDMHLQMNQLMMLGQQDPALFGLPSSMAGGMFPYDQQMLITGLPAGFEMPMNLTKENGTSGVLTDVDNLDSTKLFQCCVCNSFHTDSLESLHQHLQLDRTKQRENENIVISNGTYLCNLCTYKTNLKANFQLHCKTDKHLQRLQLVNHIKEGGSGNEWRLKYLNVSNPVQVRCNACDYYTNSIHKLQMHMGNLQHESSAQLFRHLQIEENKLNVASKYYHCTMCRFSTKTKLGLIQHVRSMKHLQNESVGKVQMKDQGKFGLDIGDVFVVKELTDGEKIRFDDEDGDRDISESAATVSEGGSDPVDKTQPEASATATSVETSTPSLVTTLTTHATTTSTSVGSSTEQQIHVCPYCNFSSVSDFRIQAHILSQHTPQPKEVLCPLCQDEFKQKAKLERHLIQAHNVTPEGLQRLLIMVDHGEWALPQASPSPNQNQIQHTPTIPNVDESGEINLEAFETEHTKLIAEDGIDLTCLSEKNDIDNQYRCQTCSKTFANIDQLYAHQNELGHLELKQTPRGPGYLCWKKGCNQYFKTAQALQVHFREIHAKRHSLSVAECSLYKYCCSQCSLAFLSAEKLKLHTVYHLIQSVTRCSICSRSFHSIATLRKHYESSHTDLSKSELEKQASTLSANALTLCGNPSFEKFILKPATSSASTSIASASTASATAMTVTATSLVPSSPESPGERNSVQDMMQEDENDPDTSCSETLDMNNESSLKDSAKYFAEVEEKLQQSGIEADTLVGSSYKEQQFMEDFINSQAMAEGSYEDPGRKYKCHRCKVAFTKQSYLTAHNKTLQHRRGDKLSYPIERYLDPNRPFKCDVCKESFTQKNILLVHYNSVSHLHKLKQAAQQGTLPPSISVNSPTTSTSTPTTQSNSVTDSDKKPYRCNICKVAYNQGSTLDIHIRSVAHQTRAAKIHELAMTGQIDINKPLIEQPDVAASSQHQVQALSDMLQQKQGQVTVGNSIQQASLIFQGIPANISGIAQLSQLPVLPGMQIPSTTAAILSPTSTQVIVQEGEVPSSSEQKINSDSVSSAQNAEQTDSGKETEISKGKTEIVKEVKKEPTKYIEEQSPLTTEEKQKSNNKDIGQLSIKISQSQPMDSSADSSGMNQLTYGCQRCNSTFVSQEALQTHQQIYCFLQGSSGTTLTAQSASRSRYFGRFKLQVQKNLLENIGFECVMQFNEYNQYRRIKKEKEESEPKKEESVEEKVEIKEQKEEKEIKEEEGAKKKPDLPEINKSSCLSCGKDFSSVWVLKAHQEEVHKALVPINVVEDFGQKFKTDFEQKQPKDETSAPPSQSGSGNQSSASASTSDKGSSQDMPPPPPPPPQMPAHFDMSQVMPMFGMMPMPLPMNLMGLGMHPPLMPMMMPPGMDMASFMPPLPVMDPSFMATQQQIQQAAQNQKRVRTRISDEQLKILRGYFDINNSPSEEQIQQMSDQSGLPPKVIKHWFRNTLFKERQRNKDSPYNFSNPPSTSIDLEEYEKTGKIPEVKSEPKDDYEDEEEDDDLALREHESESEPERERERIEHILKLETATQFEPPEDRREFESYSNASTPSTTSSIPSTPTASVPTTPTSNTTPNSEDHIGELSGGSTGKRASRTRFTDYQIKMLQEYFEQNAYPKDDELDHLSKLLNLSPRVIVVWFQNARQKARKIYENQPATEVKDSNTPFQRTPGLNYQCKKCNAVFQRYYELIKHQKRPCLSENNNNNNTTSSVNMDEDSNSTTISQDDLSQAGSISESKDSSTKEASQSATFKCDKCDASYNRLDLWQEHQKIHTMNPSLFSGFHSSSAFGMLQTLAQAEDNKTAVKRKLCEGEEDGDQPRDKRLRTTILPEQLDYLYQKYQLDCNPSRKQLETIAQEVGLKKRVVQVWFQNTRARERKGQFRAHQQLIHKRCPFCRALFRAKTALESHLATKHPEEMAKSEINVDAIPDASIDATSPTSPQSLPGTSSASGPTSSDLNQLLSPAGMQHFLPFMPSTSLGLGFPPVSDPLQMSMKQIYEDSFKKYISELSGASHTPKSRHSSEVLSGRRSETESRVPAPEDDEAPLDLSKPIKVNTEMDKSSDGPSTDVSERSSEEHGLCRRISMDDSVSETYSEVADADCDDLNTSMGSPSSPSSLGHSQSNKRYRTQMTSQQVKVMKTLFADYKTPTMAECELLGHEIGLPKRVVQVWFQNARAKEKKSKLAYAKTFGTDVEFNKPPRDCSLCNFKYSHKFTVQDHIFTKKHIDNVKSFIQSQTEAEREMSDPTGMSTLLRQQRELDRVRKVWDDASTSTPHLAQLQAMGMNALGLPGATGGSALGLTPPSPMVSEPPSIKKHSNSRQNDEDKKETKSETTSSKQQEQQAVSAEMAMNAQMMSALGGFLPGMDPSFLPYMYPGLPGYFPGMGMPLLQPGLIPGAEHLMAYDPLSFGTPLPLLQIPQQAIKLVTDKLTDPKVGLAQYTQDCKTLSDLKSSVSSVDYSCAREARVDVGYICKKCQMVYPAKDACVSHQRTMCFVGGKIPENVKPMLKLEQVQYECRACSDRFSTIYEFKLHCQMESHKVKANKFHQRKPSLEGSSSSLKPSNIKQKRKHSEGSVGGQRHISDVPELKKPKIQTNATDY